MKAKETKNITIRCSTIYVATALICYAFYRMGISQGIKEAKHDN